MLPWLLLMFVAGADRAAADRPQRLSARLARHLLRRLDQRHVFARADRSSRLAARVPRLERRLGCRPQARARRPDARNLQRPVARHRAGDDHLPRGRRRGAGAVLGRRPGRARSARAYALSLAGGTALGFLLLASNDNRSRCATPCRRCGCRMPCSAGRLLYGLAWLSPGDWKKRLALGRRCRRGHCRLSRADVAALPAAAGGRFARSRAAVAQPCARSTADLSCTAGGWRW